MGVEKRTPGGLEEIWESRAPKILKDVNSLDAKIVEALKEAALFSFPRDQAAEYFAKRLIELIEYVAYQREAKRTRKPVEPKPKPIEIETTTCIMNRCNSEVSKQWKGHNICGRCSWMIEKEEMQLSSGRIQKSEMVYHKRLSDILSTKDFEFNMVSRRLKAKIDQRIGRTSKTRQKRK